MYQQNYQQQNYQQNNYQQNYQQPQQNDQQRNNPQAQPAPRVEAQGWNEPITEEAQNSSFYEILENGEYDFRVKKFERVVHSNPGKMQGQNKISLQIELDNGRGIAYDDIFWVRSWQWKQAQFFGAIGQKKHGQPLVPNWETIEGATGRCKVVKEQYQKKTGETAWKNVIKGYIIPEEGQGQGQGQAAPQLAQNTNTNLPFEI